MTLPDYLAALRRRTAPRPSKPKPTKAKLSGSGTAEVESSTTCRPAYDPEMAISIAVTALKSAPVPVDVDSPDDVSKKEAKSMSKVVGSVVSMAGMVNVVEPVAE